MRSNAVQGQDATSCPSPLYLSTWILAITWLLDANTGQHEGGQRQCVLDFAAIDHLPNFQASEELDASDELQRFWSLLTHAGDVADDHVLPVGEERGVRIQTRLQHPDVVDGEARLRGSFDHRDLLDQVQQFYLAFATIRLPGGRDAPRQLPHPPTEALDQRAPAVLVGQVPDVADVRFVTEAGTGGTEARHEPDLAVGRGAEEDGTRVFDDERLVVERLTAIRVDPHHVGHAPPLGLVQHTLREVAAQSVPTMPFLPQVCR